MVGKIKRARQKLHQVAVRVSAREEELPTPGYRAPNTAGQPESEGGSSQVEVKEWTFLSSNIFSTTKIDPENLTQKLDVDTKSIVSTKKGLSLVTLPASVSLDPRQN
ncbi:hypothetical protein GDO86_017050 [Hymenochirus boettgeri]|uniref:Uncharacterized protein n=1 Tax=Hymenochirus boettgeri TaxID=247094 RepID=A0A8T2IQA1_9PIPI|nr:hypothetical protein GDO86_017050 [Hymenochirus boettgeri]